MSELLDSFRDRTIAEALFSKIKRQSERLERPIKLMEVCGTHTMSIARFGLKSLLPSNVKLVSGPGCPVCVTPVGYLDAAIEIARRSDTIIATFGDMMKVPGSASSLTRERERGSDIRIVHSPLDAIEIAQSNPKKEIVMLAVGFETTAPSVAASLEIGAKENIENYSVLVAHKVIPEPMAALSADEFGLDGYICPAHVSAIIGAVGYKPLAEKYRIPCVITGFEPLDVAQGVSMLIRQIIDKVAIVENQYKRVVAPEGNPKAIALIDRFFVKTDTNWRGIGSIPESGLKLRDRFDKFNAEKKFDCAIVFDGKDHPACLCGEILKGLAEPTDCPLFGSACLPDNPIGACMVSSEGSCAAAYRYGDMKVAAESQ